MNNRDISDKLVDTIKKLQSLVLVNSKSRSLNKKYNINVLGDPDPNKLISKTIKELFKLNSIRGYLFEANFFRQIPSKYNGFNKDIKRGTQIDIHIQNNKISNALGYYSFLYFFYRYIVLYCGRLLKHSMGRKSLTYIFVKDILDKKYISVVDIKEILRFFINIVMDLDGSNNSPVILICKNKLHRDLPLIDIDKECFYYLKDFGYDDPPLIKDHFKIDPKYTSHYQILSTTSLGAIIQKCIKYVDENSKSIESYIAAPKTNLKTKLSGKKIKKNRNVQSKRTKVKIN